jgi:hypothetical protein
MHPKTNACSPVNSQLGAGHEPGGDRWIRWTTTGCVALLALIAGTVSYLHMHLLVELHGPPGWVAALTPLSVDGMIVAGHAAAAVGPPPRRLTRHLAAQVLCAAPFEQRADGREHQPGGTAAARRASDRHGAPNLGCCAGAAGSAGWCSRSGHGGVRNPGAAAIAWDRALAVLGGCA